MDRTTQGPLTVIGVAIRTSNETAQEIGALWGRFFSEGLADQIPERTDGSIAAVYHDYEGDHTAPYTFLLGCPVTPGTAAPDGMVAVQIPAGPFARFVSEGEQPQALMATWMTIWGAGLERAFRADYEIHRPEDPTRIEVFVGVNA